MHGAKVKNIPLCFDTHNKTVYTVRNTTIVYDIGILLGHAVAQLVETLHYKSEGRRLDSRWCHWNFSLT